MDEGGAEGAEEAEAQAEAEGLRESETVALPGAREALGGALPLREAEGEREVVGQRLLVALMEAMLALGGVLPVREVEGEREEVGQLEEEREVLKVREGELVPEEERDSVLVARPVAAAEGEMVAQGVCRAAGEGSTPAPMVCARRIAPMLGPPSEPPLGSATAPKGARGSVVPGVADHSSRKPLMSSRKRHE